MSRILVTGGGGFVGQALCPRLVEAGHQLVVSTRDAKQLWAFKGSENIKLCEVGDLGPDTDWSAALKDVEVVIHLAARVHVMKETSSDPEGEFQRSNAQATRRLAEQAVTAGVKRLVYLSTIKVNGESTSTTPYKETDIPNPQDAYSCSKRDAETHIQTISQQNTLEFTIFRPPLVYGPGVRGNFLSLLKLCNKSFPLPFDSIVNSRSLLFVDNLADAIVHSLGADAARNQTFLISDGPAVSTPELIRQMSAALNKPARLFAFPPGLLRLATTLIGKPGLMERLEGSLEIDNSLICTALDWTPPYNMVQGFKQMADAYHKQVER